MSTPAPITVVCPSCQTKFSVADHIIRGKFVKFRCKKCQGTIECDGRALSAAPPPVRPRPGTPPSTNPSRTSEPPMRLSISDGLNLDAGASLAPPRVPQLGVPPTLASVDSAAAPPAVVPDIRRPSDPFGLRRAPAVSPQLAAPALFTGPPTAVSPSDAAKLLTVDTPVEVGHTTSDPPRTGQETGQEGSGRTWRRLGIALLVAAAGAGGWALARQSAPPSVAASASPVPPVAGESKRAIITDPSGPTKTAEPAATTAVAATAATAPIKVIDPMAPVRVVPLKAIAKVEPAAKPETPAAGDNTPAPAPAAEPASPADEATAAMAAVPEQHEFDKSAARSALEDAADHAASCRNVDTPAGAARVAVTFAPSGKVTSAVIESGPFVGTAAGGCVASKFKNLHIPAFTSDDPVTVHKTITF